MTNRSVTLILLAVLIATGAWALSKDSLAAAPAVASDSPAAAGTLFEDLAPPAPPGHGVPHGMAHGQGAPAASSDVDLAAPDEAAAITWTVPSAWKSAPNPSAMRIATYKISHVGADALDADVSVVRAGGGADANIERWRGQFEGTSGEKRAVKTVHGLKVTIVELSGTYLGGSGAEVASRTGFMLVGAIVETPGLPYFFKMTGDIATIRSSRAAFDALVGSVTPS